MYANVRPNAILAQLYRKHATELGIAGLVANEAELKPSGSTDMGNVTQTVPGLHPMFYVGTEAALHSEPFAAAAGECCSAWADRTVVPECVSDVRRHAPPNS